MFYVLPCAILFLCLSVLLVLRLPRLGKRHLILVRFVLCLTLCYFVLVFFSPFSIAITSLEEERASLKCFSYVCSIFACLVLSVSSTSWCLERAVVCDCGIPWTFLLPFFCFRTFVRFALVWFCLFPLPLRLWDGLRLVIVAHPGLFSYLF